MYKLSAGTKESVLDLMNSHVYTYADLKHRLFTQCDLSQIQTGLKLPSNWRGNNIKKPYKDRVRVDISLADRLFSGCETLQTGLNGGSLGH